MDPDGPQRSDGVPANAIGSQDLKPKRGHKKSRNGCRTCKIRKIKCDERRPLCSNCALRAPGTEACDFEPMKLCGKPAISKHPLTINSKPTAAQTVQVPVDGNSGSDHGTDSSWLQALTCLPSHISASASRRRLELRLINHFQQCVSRDMHSDGRMEGRVPFWEYYVQQLAFQTDGSLQGVLALSALHLRHLCPNDRSIDKAAGYYFGSAVASLRKQINHISQYNARDAMATSLVITFYTWIVSSAVSISGPYVLPVHFFYILNGIRPLANEILPLVPELDLLWEIGWPGIFRVYDPNHESRLLSSAKQDLAHLLAAAPLDTSEETKDVYQKAADYVSALFSAVSSGVSSIAIQRALPMPNYIPGIVPLLDAYDPIALAIFARNLSVFKFIDYAWWMHGWSSPDRSSEYHVRGIASLVPREWLWTMDWPIRIVTGLIKPDKRVFEVVDDVVDANFISEF